MAFWPLRLCQRAAVLGAAAGLPGVLAGFAADLGLGLRPGERGKALRNAGGLDKVVGHVDEELEGQAEAVLDQARGEKDRLGGAEDGVAMADGAVAQIDGVAGSDHGVVGVGDGQRNKVIGAVLRARPRAWPARRPPGAPGRRRRRASRPTWRSEFRWGPGPRLPAWRPSPRAKVRFVRCSP